MKSFVRTIGFDDGYFKKGKSRETVLVGTVVRGSDLIEGFLFDRLRVDGDEATSKLARMVLDSGFYGTLRAIFLKGVTLAGFDVVDMKELNSKTGLPVIVIMRKLPDFDEIESAVKHVPNWEDKLARMKSAGRIYELERPRGKLYFQKVGISKGEARELIELTIRTGNIPECLRVSHLVASAVTLGHSRRRA